MFIRGKGKEMEEKMEDRREREGRSKFDFKSQIYYNWLWGAVASFLPNVFCTCYVKIGSLQ